MKHIFGQILQILRWLIKALMIILRKLFRVGRNRRKYWHSTELPISDSLDVQNYPQVNTISSNSPSATSKLERLKTYLNLMNQLVKCPVEQQLDILKKNPELADAGLLKLMEVQGMVSLMNRDWNSSYRLQRATHQLAQVLGEKSSIPTFSSSTDSDSQLKFILDLLQESAYSNSNPQVVYPLLERQIHKLNDTVAKYWRDWAANSLPKLEPEQASRLARVIRDFSNLILGFPFGSRSSNLEIAIAGYEIALNVFTYETLPEDWGLTQISLGVAYFNRIQGDRAENIELMILANENALKVCTHKTDPKNWAVIKTNLGNAYNERIKGNRAENIERAISSYKAALEIRTLESYPFDWALTQMNLGNTYIDRIRGERADNIELAIACCQGAMQVFTREANPQYIGMSNINLARAYTERIRENRADNIELAIDSLKTALQVCSQEISPREWAAIQDGLGAAYLERIYGSRLENIELAIEAFQAALQVRTREAEPQEWARTQTNLGGAYWERIRGRRAENIELAIETFQRALLVFSPITFPREWVSIQANLGVAYWSRIYGNRAENLEMAIEFDRAALQVHTREDYPLEWVDIQVNLGNIFVDRIQGDRGDNLEQAISSYQAALEVSTREASPRKWAIIQLNLGNAYSDRIKGDRGDNLEQAISSYQDALEVFTRKAYPREWAMLQNNLGNGYIKRVRGERVENLELAITYYKAALQVRTYEEFPQDWALGQMNLGNAYLERIQGEQSENLESVIAFCKAALGVYNRKAFPQYWATTHNNLGLAHAKQGKTSEAVAHFRAALEINTSMDNPIECLKDGINLGNTAFAIESWKTAIEGYSQAIEAVETSRSWSISETRRQEIIAQEISVYQNIIQSYINLEQPDKALEYVERSKAQNLVELIATRDLTPKGDIPQPTLNKLDELKRSIATEHKRLAIEENNRKLDMISEIERLKPQLSDYSQLNQLQQELDELIAREITPIDPSFNLTQKLNTVSFEEIKNLIDDQTAIIEWYITDNQILTFITTRHQKQPIIKQYPAADLNKFIQRISAYLKLYYFHNNWWQSQLETRLRDFAKILHFNEIISSINPKKYHKVILIPHRLLHLLPLHALPIDTLLNQGTKGRACLLDLFTGGVAYIPSCQLLQLVQNQERPHFQNLFAIQNPTDDLIYTNLEVEKIASSFPKADVLFNEKATKKAFTTAQKSSSIHCAHFSCHGTFNLISPLESALLLANNERLTLGEIFELNLNKCRLVTLSACETGLTDLSDEYVGLPNGFLYAGSPNVVSSLWTVSDLSTAFLMIKFYQNVRLNNNVSIALNKAQLWLRNITKKDLNQWIKENQLPLDATLIINLKRSLHKLSDSDYPFENPSYWAAFCAIGQ